MIRSIGTW